jgi:hypothetical protein
VEPAKLFLELGSIDDCERAYRELIKGDTLFRALDQLLHPVVRLPAESLLWMELCRGQLFEDGAEDQEAIRKWERARDMVWCALQAAEYLSKHQAELPTRQQHEMNRSIQEIADPPEFLRGDKDRESWAVGCIDAFIRKPTKSIRVPVAVEKTDDGSGSLAILHLEILQPGTGQLMHHPADKLATSFHKSFADSMGDARQAAKTLAGKDELFDSRWRLLQDNDAPLSLSVSGHSASGAAAWGWHCALTGKVYDSRVIVLAEIDSSGALSPVNGVQAKTQAIADCGRFDTIVVADGRDRSVKDHNQAVAERVLKESGKSETIRVINLHAE